MSDASTESTPRGAKSKGIALGAGLGMIFGAGLGNPAAGLVLGAALGLVLGPALVRKLS